MPTAAGKSIVIAKIVDQLQAPTVILQPSKELLHQNYWKYRAIGGVASIYSASFNSKVISDTCYATIGSIKDIGLRFRAKGFKYLLIDECHLYPRGVDSMLGKFMTDAGMERTLGLTATALKLQSNTDLDGERFSKLAMLTARSKMGSFYKHIVHVTQIQEMTSGGFWSKLVYEVKDFSGTDLEYNSTRADYTDESLRRAYYSNKTKKKIAERVRELTDRKHILIFVPSIADAHELSELMPGSRVVYSGMPDKERDMIIEGFKAGRIREVINVNILSTGFDFPELDCIIYARATASLALYYQILGRGTRIHPNKPDCLIIDYAGNLPRFGKIEELRYVQVKGYWKLVGEGDKVLTGVPIHEVGYHKLEKPDQYVFTFGAHKGKVITQVPSHYRRWLLENFDWSKPYNKKLHDALLAVEPQAVQ